MALRCRGIGCCTATAPARRTRATDSSICCAQKASRSPAPGSTCARPAGTAAEPTAGIVLSLSKWPRHAAAMPPRVRDGPIVSRRLVILGVSAAAVVGVFVPSFATTLPVGVHVTRTTNSTSVGVSAQGANVAGATAYNNGLLCAGISQQLPICTPVVEAKPARQQLPPSPVVVHHDSNGTVVAVGEVGVVISNNGEVCPRVSTQDWICVNLG